MSRVRAPRMLTLRAASRETGRSVRTLMRWIDEGMEAVWDERGRRLVREDVLQAELRKRLRRNPVHQYRMRKVLAGGDDLTTE